MDRTVRIGIIPSNTLVISLSYSCANTSASSKDQDSGRPSCDNRRAARKDFLSSRVLDRPVVSEKTGLERTVSCTAAAIRQTNVDNINLQWYSLLVRMNSDDVQRSTMHDCEWLTSCSERNHAQEARQGTGPSLVGRSLRRNVDMTSPVSRTDSANVARRSSRF